MTVEMWHHTKPLLMSGFAQLTGRVGRQTHTQTDRHHIGDRQTDRQTGTDNRQTDRHWQNVAKQTENQAVRTAHCNTPVLALC